MKRRSLRLSVLLAAGALLAAGCRPGGSKYGADPTGHGIGRVYEKRCARPLQVGLPYEYKTIEQNTFTQQGNDYDPAISPDGKWLLYASTRHSEVPEIYMKSVHGSTITRLTNSPWAEIQPCFSPDGKHFAYATNRRNNWDICIESLQGGRGPTWLTLSMKSDEISPSWHPGGEWVAFSTWNPRTSGWEMAVKSLKTGQTRYLGGGLYPKFSPDGKKLAFQRARSRKPPWYSIWTVEVDEDFNVSKPTEVVSSAKWAAINPTWSPDGRYLAFATVHESPLAQETRRILRGDDIWVVNLDGQDLVKLTDSGAPESHPAWARDGKGRDRIYFCSKIKGPQNIWSLRPRLPEPYGSIPGPLPGPKETNPPPSAPGAAAETLKTYLAPPPPATSADSK